MLRECCANSGEKTSCWRRERRTENLIYNVEFFKEPVIATDVAERARTCV